MISWVIIILFLVVLVFLSLKYREIRHKVVYGGIALIAIFFLFSFGYVYLKGNVNLGSYEGFTQIGRLYLDWLIGAAKNFGTVTSYATKQTWGLNATNFSVG